MKKCPGEDFWDRGNHPQAFRISPKKGHQKMTAPRKKPLDSAGTLEPPWNLPGCSSGGTYGTKIPGGKVLFVLSMCC